MEVNENLKAIGAVFKLSDEDMTALAADQLTHEDRVKIFKTVQARNRDEYKDFLTKDQEFTKQFYDKGHSAASGKNAGTWESIFSRELGMVKSDLTGKKPEELIDLYKALVDTKIKEATPNPDGKKPNPDAITPAMMTKAIEDAKAELSARLKGEHESVVGTLTGELSGLKGKIAETETIGVISRGIAEAFPADGPKLTLANTEKVAKLLYMDLQSEGIKFGDVDNSGIKRPYKESDQGPSLIKKAEGEHYATYVDFIKDWGVKNIGVQQSNGQEPKTVTVKAGDNPDVNTKTLQGQKTHHQSSADKYVEEMMAERAAQK